MSSRLLIKGFCLAAGCCLVSCSVLPDHRFTGGRRIVQKDHWIELAPVCLARADEDQWYVASGPPGDPAACLKFTAGLPSYNPPASFEIVRLEAIRNQKEPVTFYRLSKEKEKRQEFDYATRELWVLAQPSPTKMPPQLPEGRYRIGIHYRFDGQEYDAEWECSYKVGSEIVRWSLAHQ